MKRLFALLAVGTLFLFVGAAYADSLDLSDPTVSPVGTDFLWSYTVSVDQFEHINTAQNAAFVTLYDVNGLVSAPSYTANLAEPGGTTSVQNVGLTPFDQNPTDNPAVPNITVQYTGTSASSQTLGVLSFLDTQGPTNVVDSDFSAQATLNAGNVTQGNTSSVPVPAPEPSSLVLISLGLIGVASRFVKH